MHITGKDGNTNVFSGTDILSASGTASGYQTYESGFDFSGTITSVIIEVGGRDINLGIGPLFDDVSINILYNTINTIITESITSVEMFVALNIDAPEEVINVVEDIFESNTPIETDEGMSFEPIVIDEPSYESIEIEIAEIEIAEIEVDIENIEMEIETEIETTIEETIEETPEVETETQEEETTTEESQTEDDDSKPQPEIKKDEEEKPEQTKEQEQEKEVAEENTKQESSKEKAVKKIMKKIDDKKRYDDVNQTKTLIVMQVLGNSKSFFESQQQLNDREGFFSDMSLPDAIINDNNIAGYILFAGSEGRMEEIINSQWQTDLE